MEALGRLFDLTGSAEGGDRVNLRNARGVTFVTLGTGTVTIQRHNAASAGDSENHAVVDRFYTKDEGEWSLTTQTASHQVTAADDATAIYVSAASLPEGFDYVSAGHATAEIIAIVHDLHVQRDPEELADVEA